MSNKSIQPAVTTDAPKDPRWDQVREITQNLRSIGEELRKGPIVLGIVMAALKREHQANGGGRGGDRKSMGNNCPLIDWGTLVERESGYSRRQADNFIRLAHAFHLKVKTKKSLKINGVRKQDALTLLDPSNALSLTKEQWEDVNGIIASLTTADSMKDLMQELGLVPKPKAMPSGKTESSTLTPDQEAGQKAFHFFEGMFAPLINTRTNPEYKKLLLAMPLTSTEEIPISLCTMEAEIRAMLADIEEAKESAMKPAKGKVIEA